MLAIIVLSSGEHRAGAAAPARRADRRRRFGIAAAGGARLMVVARASKSATVPAERVAQSVAQHSARNADRRHRLHRRRLHSSSARRWRCCCCRAKASPTAARRWPSHRPMHWGGPAATIVALFAAISAFGTLNGWVLMQGELPWAMARDGGLPGLVRQAVALRHAGPRAHRRQPAADRRPRLQLQPLDGRVCSASSSCSPPPPTSSLYLGLLAGRGEAAASAARRVPIFLLAALFSLLALWGAGVEAIGWGAALLASGVPIYFVMRWRARSTPPAEPVPAAPRGPAA